MSTSIVLVVDGGHGHAEAEVDVDAGGRIAQLEVRGQRLLIDPDSAEANPDGHRNPDSTGWGCYPMAPWAGRVRNGLFRFLGTEHELPSNHQDGAGTDPARRHAIHGTVFHRPWTIDERAANAVTLSCPLGLPGRPVESLRNFGWSFGGTARQRIELLDGQLRCDLAIEVDHHHDGAAPPFLGEVGWHPWFRKPSSITFHPDAMYERDEIGLPTGRLVVPSPGPWDDCFVNTAPVTLHYDDADAVATLTLSSDCDHWVVYDMPEHATCVEPQSGPPDAFNIRPRLVTATHPLRRTMNIAW